MKHADEKITALSLPLITDGDVNTNWPGRGCHVTVTDAANFPIIIHADTPEQVLARSAYIVRACNAYPALVKVLEGLMRVSDYVDGLDGDSSQEFCAAVAEARRVLAGLEATHAQH